MARKTIGKMEFESLVSTLKDQNSKMLVAQEGTTKAIGSLTDFLFEQSRIEQRAQLEKEMEEKGSRSGKAEPGSNSKSQGGIPVPKLPRKGLGGLIASFLGTSLLGGKGFTLLKGLLPTGKIPFTIPSMFVKGLLGAAIIPSMVKAFDDGQIVADRSGASSISSIIAAFLTGTGDAKGDKSISGIAKNIASGSLKGAGIAALIPGVGIRGILIAAAIGGAGSAIAGFFGTDKTAEGIDTIGETIKDLLFGENQLIGGMGLFGAGIATIMAKHSPKFAKYGIPGLLAGAVAGASLGYFTKLKLEGKDNSEIQKEITDLLFTKTSDDKTIADWVAQLGLSQGAASWIKRINGGRGGIQGVLASLIAWQAYDTINGITLHYQNKTVAESVRDLLGNAWDYITGIFTDEVKKETKKAMTMVEKLQMAKEQQENRAQVLNTLTEGAFFGGDKKQDFKAVEESFRARELKKGPELKMGDIEKAFKKYKRTPEYNEEVAITTLTRILGSDVVRQFVSTQASTGALRLNYNALNTVLNDPAIRDKLGLAPGWAEKLLNDISSGVVRGGVGTKYSRLQKQLMKFGSSQQSLNKETGGDWLAGVKYSTPTEKGGQLKQLPAPSMEDVKSGRHATGIWTADLERRLKDLIPLNQTFASIAQAQIAMAAAQAMGPNPASDRTMSNQFTYSYNNIDNAGFDFPITSPINLATELGPVNR